MAAVMNCHWFVRLTHRSQIKFSATVLQLKQLH